MTNGAHVARFEAAFAEYVGARYAIALCNGTATLHTALAALDVRPGTEVSVPPLTMAATTMAVLHAGAKPVFRDVHPETWLMSEYGTGTPTVGVSLYGLHRDCEWWVDDAAQTLRKASPGAAFTSYSFQASKILHLGEGGMLVTDSEDLARRAREFSSLGYRMDPRQPRIDPARLKSPTFERHHRLGWNYRMSDHVAEAGLMFLQIADQLVELRREMAAAYRAAHHGCEWLTAQAVPPGTRHDYWTYAVACDTAYRARCLADAVVRLGGERPYPAWRLTYQEPAFRHLAPDGTCPVAEDLQPRLLQFQTNKLKCLDNVAALRAAIEEAA